MTTIGNIGNTGNTLPQPTPLVSDGYSSPSITGSAVFKNILDTINPLQHIPVVSSVYRAATGQTINPISKIAGDTIYGLALGGTGFLNIATTVGTSVADTATSASGSGIGNYIASAISGVTNSSGTTATPLVPDTSISASMATIQAQAAQSSTPAPIFPYDQNPHFTAAQYHHAQLSDSLNKQLLQMTT